MTRKAGRRPSVGSDHFAIQCRRLLRPWKRRNWDAARTACRYFSAFVSLLFVSLGLASLLAGLIAAGPAVFSAAAAFL